jgi:hypothetical protein
MSDYQRELDTLFQDLEAKARQLDKTNKKNRELTERFIETHTANYERLTPERKEQSIALLLGEA